MSSSKSDHKLSLTSLSKSFFSSLKRTSDSRPWRNSGPSSSLTKTKEITEVSECPTELRVGGVPRSMSMLSIPTGATSTQITVTNDGNNGNNGSTTPRSARGSNSDNKAVGGWSIPVDSFRRSLTHVMSTGKVMSEPVVHTKKYNDEEPSIVMPVPNNKWWQLDEVTPNREATTELSLEPDVPICPPETTLVFDGENVKQMYVRDVDAMEGQRLTKQVEESRVIMSDDNSKVLGARRAQQDSAIIKQYNDKDLSGWLAPSENTRTFADALVIYETDQSLLVTFLDVTNKGRIGMNERQQRVQNILNTARQLEAWFCRYVEMYDPRWDAADVQEWKNREIQRLAGISGYCDSKLRLLMQRGF